MKNNTLKNILILFLFLAPLLWPAVVAAQSGAGAEVIVRETTEEVIGRDGRGILSTHATRYQTDMTTVVLSPEGQPTSLAWVDLPFQAVIVYEVPAGTDEGAIPRVRQIRLLSAQPE